MDDQGALSQPLIGSQSSFGVSLDELKKMFNLSNIQDKMSYQSLGKLGGTEGLSKMLQASPTEGIDPASVADRIKT